MADQKRAEGILSYGSQTEVEIADDVWQEMKVQFTVYHPQDSLTSIEIKSNKPQLNQAQMSKMNIPEQWLQTKYGKKVRPFEYTFSLPNTDGDSCGQWKHSD